MALKSLDSASVLCLLMGVHPVGSTISSPLQHEKPWVSQRAYTSAYVTTNQSIWGRGGETIQFLRHLRTLMNLPRLLQRTTRKTTFIHSFIHPCLKLLSSRRKVNLALYRNSTVKSTPLFPSKSEKVTYCWSDKRCTWIGENALTRAARSRKEAGQHSPLSTNKEENSWSIRGL